MNAIRHMAAQIMNAEPPKAAADTVPKRRANRNQALRPCISIRGRQIEALHQQGMKLVDVARELGINYNGLRGVYSTYRRAKDQGLI